jgi:hypothetical protein
MSTVRTDVSRLRDDSDDDYVVVDARQVILDLPGLMPGTEQLRAIGRLPTRSVAAGGHAEWLRGPRRRGVDKLAG